MANQNGQTPEKLNATGMMSNVAQGAFNVPGGGHNLKFQHEQLNRFKQSFLSKTNQRHNANG